MTGGYEYDSRWYLCADVYGFAKDNFPCGFCGRLSFVVIYRKKGKG